MTPNIALKRSTGILFPRSWSRWSIYIVTLTGTILVLIVSFVTGLLALQRANSLPPPAFVNSLCADAKLEFFRDQPNRAPATLIVGSSIAWRNVSSEVLERAQPAANPLNGGICGLQINQTDFATTFLLERFPSVRNVLAVVNIEDMRACGKTSSTLFHRNDVAAYLSRRRWWWWYYIRYFDPVSIVRNAWSIRAQRANAVPLDPLVFTRYGDGPLNTDQSRDLSYQAFSGFDPACDRALARLATDVANSGRHLVLLISPMHPGWNTLYDRDGALHSSFLDHIRSATAGTGTQLLDGSIASGLTAADFTDAVHLRWTGAVRFTETFSHRLKLDPTL